MKNTLRLSLLLAIAAAGRLSAAPAAEYQSGWDATGCFRMFVRLHVDPSGALFIEGGSLWFKDGTTPAVVTQASRLGGAGVMTGGVINGSLITAFSGTLSGAFGRGPITTSNVYLNFHSRNYTTQFVLNPASGGGLTAATPAPPVRLNPVGLTTQQMQAIRNFDHSKPLAAVSSAPPSLLLDNTNSGAVGNGANPRATADLLLSSPTEVTEIWTYHWNGGRGQAPGTIALRDGAGRLYGPWPASGSAGTNNASNVNWDVRPHLSLPAGLYTVIDSSPDTWSQNAMSRGAGFTKVWGVR